MKVIFFMPAAAVALVFPLPVQASDPQSPLPAPVQAQEPAPGAKTSEVENENRIVLEAWGRVIAEETEAARFGLGEGERSALARGLVAGARKRPPPHDLDRIYTDVSRFVETHRAVVREARRRENLAAAPAYFEALRRRPGVIARESGLCYEILHSGSEVKAKPGQTVVVTYRAHLADGTEFDSTDQAGPVEIRLGRTVPGWTEGLQLIGVGGRIRLHLPPALGFDDEEASKLGIPPAAIVVSELDVLAVKESAPEEPVPPSAPVPPPPPPAGFSDEEILETWGWILAQERGVMQASLDEASLKALVRGLNAALAGEVAALDEKAFRPQVAGFVAGRRRAFEAETRRAREAENAAYFEKIAAGPGVVRLPSGLCYEILRPGEGPFPRPDQRVRVNYVGHLINGTVFDRTDPELGPLDIDLARVVRGWTEGMQKINRGGIIRLHVPPALAYGDVSTGGIPANSALIFEVELLEIRDVPADAAVVGAAGASM